MTKKRILHNLKFWMGILTAIILASVAGLVASDVVLASSDGDLKTATQCSFIIPPQFVPGDGEGLFRHKDYPMESSSISYNIYYNGKDKVLTNREKQALLQKAEAALVDESENLTKEIYQDLMSEAYSGEYGKNVDFTVTAFSQKSFDGYPGYKIISEFQPEGEMRVHQTVYIILSKYRTFTITFQGAEDDECQELFDQSAATIHVN